MAYEFPLVLVYLGVEWGVTLRQGRRFLFDRWKGLEVWFREACTRIRNAADRRRAAVANGHY